MGVERPLIESGALDRSATPTYGIYETKITIQIVLVISILAASARSLNRPDAASPQTQPQLTQLSSQASG